MTLPLGIARNLVVNHEPVNKLLEFPPRLILATKHENRRLADRFPGHEPEVRAFHADCHVNRPARTSKSRLPRPRPANCEEVAVPVVEIELQERDMVVRRPPAGCRQDLLLTSFDRERFRNKVGRGAGRSAENVQADLTCGLGNLDQAVQRPEIADRSRRLGPGQVRQPDRVLFSRKILVDS